MANPKYKPVEVHKRVMNEIVPALRYEGGSEQWQVALRNKLDELLGLDRMPARKCALEVRTLWKRDTQHGTIEKIVFSSEQDHDVPAYVCLPANASRPYTFFICLQGHSSGMHNSIAVDRENETRGIIVEGDRDFAIGCMRRGIAAMCIEQRGFGECTDIHDSWTLACHNPSAHAMMLGRTLVGERVFDVDRAIDYLETRSDVDMKKVGVMGNSGGGTVAMFAGGLLDRISYVMPSCCVSSFKDSIMSIDHCICNYVPNLLCYADCSDILCLTAPKPLVIVSGRTDAIFPIDSARKSFDKVKTVYKELYAEHLCHHIIGKGGHRFYADAAWPVMQSLLSR